jgi:predicted lactoylglutathione lyase
MFPASRKEDDMATATEPQLKAKTLSTSLTVNDINQSVRFFEGLGFTIDEKWEQDGKLAGVMMKAGEAQIGLMQDDWKKGKDRQKGVGMRLFISTTQNIDDLATRAKENGVRIDVEPHDTEWKSRAFEVTEPTGFKITISSHVE